jgi:chorismate synthase
MGLGAEAASVAGKDRNEDWKFADGETRPNTVAQEGDPVPVGNDHGGLQGGITTGEPICGEATWHAPTSIPAEQTTVDWETGEEKQVHVVGRHDPSLPPRAVPVVEAVLYCTILDFALLDGRVNPDRLDDSPGQYDTHYHPSSPENAE